MPTSPAVVVIKGSEYEMTMEGRTLADARDSDGQITLLREAVDIYEGRTKDNLARADGNLLLVYLRGRELESDEIMKAALAVSHGPAQHPVRT